MGTAVSSLIYAVSEISELGSDKMGCYQGLLLLATTRFVGKSLGVRITRCGISSHTRLESCQRQCAYYTSLPDHTTDFYQMMKTVVLYMKCRL